MSHRTNRCPNHRSRNDFQWYRPENPNPTCFGAEQPASNPATVFVQQDTRPVVNIEPRPTAAVSPDVLIYDPNVEPTPNIENDIQDTTQAADQESIIMQNLSGINSRVPRHQTASRCPYYQRLSTIPGFRIAPSNYHSSLQNGNGYLRPAYAPHESLWYRQQNQQEIHRRHMMNSMSGTGASNDTAQPSSFGPYPSRGSTSISNNGHCTQCDQQHPIGHPHRRIRGAYVCGLNLVSIL